MNEVFLGAVKLETLLKPWTAKVTMQISPDGPRDIQFKLDSGAAVTVCVVDNTTPNATVSDCSKRLVGTGNLSILCMGVVKARLSYRNRYLDEDVFVAREQKVNLLSKRACKGLKPLSCNIGETTVEDYKSVLEGLGKVKGACYQIELVDNAQSFAITDPRSVPFPLLDQTKA